VIVPVEYKQGESAPLVVKVQGEEAVPVTVTVPPPRSVATAALLVPEVVMLIPEAVIVPP